MSSKILHLFGDHFAPEALALLSSMGEVKSIAPDRTEAMKLIKDCDIVVTGLGIVMDRALMDAAPKLRIIATPTTGLDHIDLQAAEEKGITVLSLRGEEALLRTITPTAELAFGLMIALVRGIVPAAESVKEGAWKREQFLGHSLPGKTLGIVGVGRLGSMMVRYGTAFGMRILGCDPAQESDGSWEKMGFDDVLMTSDMVSVHVHLMKETTHLFNADTFSRMKPGAFLINTSRGKIIDEQALVATLKSGRLGGYAADVLDGELEGDISVHPLVEYARTHPNVLLTPHIGGMTAEARSATDMFIIEKLQRFLQA